MSRTKKKTVKAWASVGSHDKIFMFIGGAIADKYPSLMEVYFYKVSEDLIPITITYEVKK